MSSFSVHNRDLVRIFEQACLTSGFRDFMPAAMIDHFVRQIIPSSVRDNVLETDQFYLWVRKEYSIPDHIFSRVFSRVKEELSGLGMEIKLPPGFDPGMNESIRDWLRSELKEVVYADLKDEMEKDIKEQLRQELRPEVYRELRQRFEQEEDQEAEGIEVEIDLDGDESEEEAESSAELEPAPSGYEPAEEGGSFFPEQEAYADAGEEQAGASDHTIPIGQDDSASFFGSESFDRDAWGEKLDRSSSVGLGVDAHLEIIKRLRSELTVSIKEELISELGSLARAKEEKDRRETLRQRLSDPDYCLERIRDFLYPDRPALFDKVRHLINPPEWQTLVLAWEQGSLAMTEEMERALSIIREALQTKAEIEKAGYPASSRAIQGVLVEADRMLDFSLQSISSVLKEKVPRPITAGLPEGSEV
ncbi:MAG: hypothetical protein R6V10_12870 [bacterium]